MKFSTYYNAAFWTQWCFILLFRIAITAHFCFPHDHWYFFIFPLSFCWYIEYYVDILGYMLCVDINVDKHCVNHSRVWPFNLLSGLFCTWATFWFKKSGGWRCILTLTPKNLTKSYKNYLQNTQHVVLRNRPTLSLATERLTCLKNPCSEEPVHHHCSFLFCTGSSREKQKHMPWNRKPKQKQNRWQRRLMPGRITKMQPWLTWSWKHYQRYGRVSPGVNLTLNQ